MSTPAAGFYPDPTPGAAPGQMRYFDGTSWTEQVQAAPPAAPWAGAPAPQADAVAPAAPLAGGQPPKRRVGRVIAIVLGSVVALFVLMIAFGAALGGSSDTNDVGATPSAEADAPRPSPEEEPAAEAEALPAQSAAGMTCDALIPEVIALSASEKSGLVPQIIAIYDPVVAVDNMQAYTDRNLPIPAGQHQVSVLTCTGTASASDLNDYPITFSALVDANDQLFVSYEDVS
ncbi:DUF2510 domain-containing protein [Cellulomonas dongxiuzhuiae]|uniref:DUF2510 domain-containing protein n=1 Tax=Cellulomonas dongxiuzhuiae TaxID=2819979 RepID=A0ABX8GLB0_9CELL|nr:DUF2510 domain-containing protein [Cellulomonas dongxiuzhuiae]MBO3090083.1 DUF2510 domain-containing protein [Cellulomonas dongxiuzhuiae]MBO3095475.1 DUF2510 domain-containing protein [Cellulomonas dongxiuzhuiae]QWC16456.1 DUF2510 domain-containing protein [Cellulomonas dongxiuzhuiae]